MSKPKENTSIFKLLCNEQAFDRCNQVLNKYIYMQYCKEINPDSSSALVTIYIKECMVPCRFLPSIKPTRTGAPMHRTYYSRKRKNEASKF